MYSVLVIVIVILAVALAGAMIGVGVAAVRSNHQEAKRQEIAPVSKPNEDLYEVGCVSIVWNPQAEQPKGDVYSILALYDGKIDGLASPSSQKTA